MDTLIDMLDAKTSLSRLVQALEDGALILLTADPVLAGYGTAVMNTG